MGGCVIESQLGRYEILRELGHGAMGVVYAALDPLIKRQVAIKTIRLDMMEGAEARADLTRRLFREAQAAGILSHPGIVTIYDIGERGKIAYIVMEFVSGKNIEELFASGIQLNPENQILILKKAAAALDFAHSKGVIHRDVKPSNIMVCPDRTVKIADFGIAKAAASNSMTQPGLIVGTPNYMSPEQAQGKETDGRSDQFSLAVIAYRMATGKLPFEGPTLTSLLTKLLWEEPDYGSAGIPNSLRPVFERALSKDPQGRFPTCLDFIQAVETGYAQLSMNCAEPIPVTGAAKTEAEPAAVSAEHSRHVARPVAPRKKTASIAWIAGLAILILAAAGLVGFWKMRAPDSAVQSVSETSVTVSVEPAKPVAPAVINQSKSGVFRWSGALESNTVLVVAGSEASTGSVSGDFFPGAPVYIEVEPREVMVRQMPDESNNWRQIILYSSAKKLSAITVHWQTID